MTLDKSWLPEPEKRPGGGYKVPIPTDTEWMMAGGKVKTTKSTLSGAAKFVDNWEDIFDNILASRDWESIKVKGGSDHSCLELLSVLRGWIEGWSWAEVPFVDKKGIKNNLKQNFRHEGFNDADFNFMMSILKKIIEDAEIHIVARELVNPKEAFGDAPNHTDKHTGI